MVKVKINDVLNASKMRSGKSKDGKPWAFIAVEAEKSYDKITVWAANPDEVKGASGVKILEITDVSLTKTKKTMENGQDRWYENCNVTARLSKEAGIFNGNGFVPAEDAFEDIFKL